MSEEMSAKEEIMQDWPTAIAVREQTGWCIYGGIENQMEMDARLAIDQPSEDEAWEEALNYYRDMVKESTND